MEMIFFAEAANNQHVKHGCVNYAVGERAPETCNCI